MTAAASSTAGVKRDTEPGSRSRTQYLTFLLDDEEYGIDILGVQEIKSWGPCTKLPNTPDYVLGVVNLRGAVVPVIDLRCRLGMPVRQPDRLTVVIVIRLPAEAGEKTVGVMVDAVSDVYDIAPDEVSAPPALDPSLDGRFVRGLATIEDRMIILLDLSHVVGNG